jgi:hypothetical protein
VCRIEIQERKKNIIVFELAVYVSRVPLPLRLLTYTLFFAHFRIFEGGAFVCIA